MESRLAYSCLAHSFFGFYRLICSLTAYCVMAILQAFLLLENWGFQIPSDGLRIPSCGVISPNCGVVSPKFGMVSPSEGFAENNNLKK